MDYHQLWYDYVFGKQTLLQLSERYKISVGSIQRYSRKAHSVRIIPSEKDAVLLTDTTCRGRNFGVVVFKDARRKKIVWRKSVRYETPANYAEGIGWMEANGFQINGTVCDGLREMFSLSGRYKVQLCQYHQMKTVKRYLTVHPEPEASKELLKTVNLPAHSDLDKFLKERSTDKMTEKCYYVHKKLRSAYLSLKRNMPYLWTFYDYPEVNIPNTNNGLEGQFADLKTKPGNHSGLSKKSQENLY